MIANRLDVLAVARSARIGRAKLTAQRISVTFRDIRRGLKARTLHSEIRSSDRASGVTWSLWVGRFPKSVSWLLSDRFQETRYGFLLLLEKEGFIGILGSNIGDVGDAVSDSDVSYQKLLALHAGADAEVESISTRSLRSASVGVMRSTQSGRHLERSLSRVGANQAAPLQLSLRRADKAWRVSPGSGRVALSGGRAAIPDLCNWFSDTCKDIDNATEPSDFIKAFAHPIALNDLPADVVPTSLQLDPTVVDDLIDQGATLQHNDTPMVDTQIEELRQLIRTMWLVETEQDEADKEKRTWRLLAGQVPAGRIVFRSTKISFASDILEGVQVVYDDGTKENLSQVFNSGTQPFRMTFSDATYAYAATQLFRDHRLLGSRTDLLGVLTATLPTRAQVEKGHDQGRFTADSLFGFVVNQASNSDQFLVCDDMGTEWADFIGVSSAEHRITFYHCKGGRVDVGASGLHEIVSQASKKLGYLTASAAELDSRRRKWTGRWNNRGVPRLQRGSSIPDFITGFTKAVAAPQATRRVTLITSSLSKAAVARAFAEMDAAPPRVEALHVLWLLSVFVDQCRTLGAVPEIICRP
jgi:hypothetical protein